MITPAQKRGIFAGKKYIVTAKEGESNAFGSGVAAGDTVVISDDDGSIYPYFDKLDAEGKVERSRIIIAVPRAIFTPVNENEGVKFEAATRTIETTIITVDRKLTPAEQAEIAAIIKKGN